MTVYPDPYDSGGRYWGDPYQMAPRCPICGAIGLCVGVSGAPLDIPAFDLDDLEPVTGGGPLRRYRVTLWGYDTVMQLNDQDAVAYGGVLLD